MKTFSLTVNGKKCSATVEPRTSLADYLREHLLLTGTHLGCEHGVCGSCTVNIDGAPVRSCITLAVACDGVDVRTIEGFDNDQIMADLRHAFSSHHALQCGYCTPGMLITSRDIVQRHSNADEDQIRVELSGNLCRCTGYVGIVDAVRQVVEAKAQQEGSTGTVEPQLRVTPSNLIQPLPPNPGTVPPRSDQIFDQDVFGDGMTRLKQSFIIPQSRDTVWELFQDLELIVACMPGASLDVPSEEGTIRGQVAVRVGPIHAKFSGIGEIKFDPEKYSGVVHGKGRDRGHGAQVRGGFQFELTEDQNGEATRVDVNVAFALSGTLAQFSRGSIFEAISDQLTKTFAANLSAAIGLASGTRAQSIDRAGGINELKLGSLIFQAMWARIRTIAEKFKRFGW